MDSIKFPSWAPADAVWFYRHELSCSEALPNATSNVRVFASCSRIASKLLTDARAESIWRKIKKENVPADEFLGVASGWAGWILEREEADSAMRWCALTKAERRDRCDEIAQAVEQLQRLVRETPITWCEENGGAGSAVNGLCAISDAATVLRNDEPAFGRDDGTVDVREFVIRVALFLQSRCKKSLAGVVGDCVELVFGVERMDETRVYALLREFKARNSVEARLLSNRNLSIR